MRLTYEVLLELLGDFFTLGMGDCACYASLKSVDLVQYGQDWPIFRNISKTHVNKWIVS